MDNQPQKPHDVGYAAMMQIGIEMAAPVGLGFWLDHLWDWFPWLTITGVFLGFSLGIVEILRVGNQGGKNGPKDPQAHG